MILAASEQADVPKRWSRRSVLLGRAAALLLGVLVPLLALEGALRVFGPFLPGNYDTGQYVARHPTLGHFHVPNFRGWIKAPHFTVHLAFNQLGFRDARRSYAKSPGTYRILALGDSYVEAAQVQADETVTSRLERALGERASQSVEVVNAGVFGYGTAQQYLLLDQEGENVAPDLILLFFCHCNDVPNNNYRLELPDADLGRALKPYFDMGEYDDELKLIPAPPPSRSTSVRQLLREWSMLYNVVETGVVLKLELDNPREAWNAVGGLIDETRGKYDVEPRDEWLRGWRITEAVLARLRDRANELGAPLVIVSIPEWRAFDEAYWQRDNQKRNVNAGKMRPDAPVSHLAEIARSIGVRHVDLTDALQARIDAEGLHGVYIEDDLHWTTTGHRVAADVVGSFLIEEGLVP